MEVGGFLTTYVSDMRTSLFFMACYVTVIGGDVLEDCRKMLYYTVNTLSFFKGMKKARKSKPFSSGIYHLTKVAPTKKRH